MSDVNRKRCPNDDWIDGIAKVGENPRTGKAVELNVHGVSSVVAIQSALMTLTAAMKAGHEDDFLEKVALCVYGKVETDPHVLCPLLCICSMILLLVNGNAGVKFSENGQISIEPEDVEYEGSARDQCMYDIEEDYDGTDEGTMDSDGTAPGGPGDGINPT